MTETIELLVDGGKATAGPPLGPALGPMGVNIGQVVGDINKKTKAFDGMKVPVKLEIDPKTKEYEITVGTPPASALIMKELGIEKGSSEPSTDFVADMTIDQLKKIAEMKQDATLGNDMKAMALEISGTCVSMGVTIEGHSPKKMQRLINQGKYDDDLS